MDMPDLARVASIIREVAEAEILPRFRALRAGDIREKAPGDFVTAADMASEAALTPRLRALLPGSAVLGEEAAAEDESLFGLLDGDAPVWIVDPVDGTINFAQGKPGFAVIVALVRGGATQAGWILDPLAGEMVVAARGAGAWRDGTQLRLTDAVPVGAMVGAAYGKIGSPTRSAELLIESGRIGAVVNRASSGIDYLALALGRAQFLLSSRSLPWDHAAGVLIAEEIGATAGFIDGTPYDPRVRDRGVLSAASRAGWEVIREIVLGAADHEAAPSGR
jgi:fructose-1,6-bisphosphatase/inositol monophosphatase family enzyme